jgi:hypothetical protein
MQEKLPWTAQNLAIVAIHVAGKEFNLSHLPGDLAHADGFGDAYFNAWVRCDGHCWICIQPLPICQDVQT